jgi:hypothetical protein
MGYEIHFPLLPSEHLELSAHPCRSSFMTLSPVLLQEQPAVLLLLERALVSWSLAMDEYSGHEDLRGSNRRSVISYVHGRTKLYCSSLAFPESGYLSVNLFSTPMKRRLSEPFIAQGQAITLRPRARQVAPKWLKFYTASRVIMARSGK